MLINKNITKSIINAVFASKYLYLIILTIVLCSFDTAYSQFNQKNQRSLFSDVKAYKEGDAVLILIVEETSANNAATTSNSRSSSLSASLSNNNKSIINGSLGTGNSFSGTGSTERKETIQSKLSAKIVSVEANGNLKIEGTRVTKINGETQTIVIQGTVRTVDIQSDNSVYSYNIYDLTLTIQGDGPVTKIQEPGLITKFLRTLF